MERHPNWRAAIGARVRCTNRRGTWTIISRGSGRLPVVKIQSDPQLLVGTPAMRIGPISAAPIVVPIAHLQPIWPPEPGMLVEVRAEGPIGEVMCVTESDSLIRVDVRMTEPTFGAPAGRPLLKSFNCDELAAL